MAPVDRITGFFLFLLTPITTLYTALFGPQADETITANLSVHDLCTTTSSVTSVLSLHHAIVLPTTTPNTPLSVFRLLFHSPSPSILRSLAWIIGFRKVADPAIDCPAPTDEQLETVRKAGSYGDVQVSKLFLQCQYHVMKTLEADPGGNVCSPGLMGSTGYCPLTIVSSVPDILRHYARCIVEAEYDIILGTNFWRGGEASGILSDALKELSRRIIARGGEKVVVKIIFDRGSINMINPRQIISEKDYTASGIGLPKLQDIPQVDLEVMNYHNFPVGTFHSKFLVVDRRIALLNSCNIQDNSNLEMLAHFTGPIVDAIYDMTIISWGTTLSPPFPSLQAVDPTSHLYTSAIPDLTALQAEAAAENARLDPQEGETKIQPITRCLNNTYQPTITGTTTWSPEDESRPYIPYVTHPLHRVAMTLVNRKAYATPGHASLSTPQNVAWLSALRYAERDVYIQTPDLNAEPLIPALLTTINRGIVVTLVLCLGYNDFGEMLPLQGGANDDVVKALYRALPEEKKAGLRVCWYIGRDMTQPINATEAVRTCHIKLMVVDQHLTIMGSGNQDTQSWFHSQEVNVMIDDPEMAVGLMKQLDGNQNSGEFGMVGKDGVWNGRDGEVLGGRWEGLWKRGRRYWGYQV